MTKGKPLIKFFCVPYKVDNDEPEFHNPVLYRGTFSFYGASRTGRFSGRNIQFQNLPQNHIPDLAGTREIIRNGDFELAELLYDNIPDILSQLIRTALIPKDGYKFIVADFSSIEARALAWIAGETWRMQAFARGDDIYCASASKMFGVPVVKHGVNGHLSQKGKVAELACIAEGQLVLTNHGLIPIEKREFDEKKIEKPPQSAIMRITTNSKKQKDGFFYGTGGNFL